MGDEMGLGKTIQALAAMVHLKNHEETHFLVICPASVITNWCREIEAKSDLNVIKIHGTFKDDRFDIWKTNGGVAVTNYESLSWLMNMEESFHQASSTPSMLIMASPIRMPSTPTTAEEV